ncbi:DUF6081 family protein [Streptomyces cellulosae]|uniref:DUF6081 family protein n=1 Tax=Streptomyces sp. SID4956 TaxID=2690290 RepID=UPI00136A39F8|nr:hypothetical protein [Streptomyces sp. SID4956]WSB53097.1 DUF6081 family protein [Streptomyces cellulosae]WTB68121.1 DUF6081 family protein [Streptomyces cellulosae]
MTPLWEDDFRDPELTLRRWAPMTLGSFVPDDADVHVTPEAGLRVAAGGTHPHTGEPAFTRTLGQENGDPSALPGALDAVKWLVYADHSASGGLPGFDAAEGEELLFEAWLSARTYGTAGHPFGSAVADPGTDWRLACAAMNVADVETGLAFDFFLTDQGIHAVHERLPMLRPHLGDYASFTAVVPVARREPEQEHRLGIGYDRSAGRVRWLVDGVEVHRAEHVGRVPGREHVVLDHGGDDAEVEPRQLNCGLGLFTALDCSFGSGPGLVRLTGAPDFYFRAVDGRREPQVFLDDKSLRDHRLFGQGASLSVRRCTVSASRVTW